MKLADITMCSSKHCPVRKNCYRSTAKPCNFQSWSNFEEVCNENNDFHVFIKSEVSETA